MTAPRAGLALVLVASVLWAGCGTERSAEAYCRSFYTKAAPIREGYVKAGEQVNENPLDAVVKVLSAPGDMVSIFDSMIDHAPDEIRSDTVIVRDSFKKLQDGMGKAFSDPIGALGDSLVNSLSSAGAMERVDAYLGQHCPVDSELAQEIINGSG